LSSLGISNPDVELAKADLATRVHRLAQFRHCSSDEAAALLGVATSELPALLQGRLATCSVDQLLRLLTWLGDDVEIIIRPRLQGPQRGTLRVLQTGAVEGPKGFKPPNNHRSSERSVASASERAQAELTRIGTASGGDAISVAARDDRQLLNKHAVEKLTSLDITTIYRRMAAGTFPQPVRVGRRRVAWRTSDVVRWQQGLETGTQTLRWKTNRSTPKDREGGRPRGGG
jgi:predicted DNA-binding transcriptional regulator AlpA/predicted XRE-type DNA-binding protein